MKIITPLVLLCFIGTMINCHSPLKFQEINYTENPVDIPNIDRGFYRPQSYIVPVEGGSVPTIPDLKATISGTDVTVDSRIVYMEFDLRNFSSNAPLTGMPAGEWSDVSPEYGKTQPLTTAALDYIKSALRSVRESEAVAIVKFSYDGRGYTYNNRGGYNQFIHDCEPGAPEGRAWYESGGRDGGVAEESDLCGMEGHENKNWIQYHLWQIGDVFNEFEDVIMTVKGGFFGPWGEMHSSSYARSAEGYHWLLNALLDYVPSSRSILVHAGGVMAWQNIEYGTSYSFNNLPPIPERDSRAQRFGMFNDSYSRGGEDFTDGGSLSEGNSLIGGDFERNAAFKWIRNQSNFYGGETVRSGNEPDNYYQLYPRFPNVPYEAAFAQTTHLNTSYSSAAYSLWSDFIYNEENVTTPFTPQHDGVTRTAIFDSMYDGRNGMEYMRDRLGFRFVLRESKVSEEVSTNGVLRFEGKIQNVGFGLLVNKKNVSIIIQDKTGSNTFSVLTDIDARDWLPDLDGRATNRSAWIDLKQSIKMSTFGNVPAGDYDIYLKINDPKETSINRRSIRFANTGDVWNANLGANYIGSTVIK